MTDVNPVPQFSKAEFEPELVDSHGHFVRGLLFGVIGALAGLALYAGIVIITEYEIGFVSLAVGWMVGKAILFGSQGRGGRRYQIAAVLLTYFAVSMAIIPIAIWEFSKMASVEAGTAAGSAAPGAPTPTPSPGAVAGTSVDETDEPISLSSVAGGLLWLGLASPFLRLADGSGIISLIILAVGIHMAWKMTGLQRVVIPMGPNPETAEKPTTLDLNR